MQRKKVYVVNDSGHDMTDAKRFGDLVILTSGEIRKFHVTWHFRQFIDKLAESQSNDYILISGPSVANCVACVIFAVMHQRINFLLFTGEKYIVKELMLKEVK